MSIRSGLLFASSRLASILVWSLFAGCVGFIIQSLERRFGLVGRIVLRVVGVVWSVASVFVIPVIVREPDLHPVELLRKSAGSLRKTWGEGLIGYIGIQSVLTLFVLASLVALFMTAIPALIYGVWQVALLWLYSGSFPSSPSATPPASWTKSIAALYTSMPPKA